MFSELIDLTVIEILVINWEVYFLCRYIFSITEYRPVQLHIKFSWKIHVDFMNYIFRQFNCIYFWTPFFSRNY